MTNQSRVARARIHLIGELHKGTRFPGMAINVKETAEVLRLSATPVREALAHLAGEGLVVSTRCRNGFAVPRFTPSDLVDLMDVLRLLLNHAIEGRAVRDHDELQVSAAAGEDPALRIEALVAWLTEGHHNRRVTATITRMGIILAPYRRVEPALIPSWSDELDRLPAMVRTGKWRPAFRSFWHARYSRAVDIIAAVERRFAAPEIF